jgi:hypothetical protein
MYLQHCDLFYIQIPCGGMMDEQCVYVQKYTLLSNITIPTKMTICTQHLFDITAFQFVRRQLWNWTTIHIKIITSVVFIDDN